MTMDFGYGSSFTEASPEAYERLILDVLLGEPPLFPRHEEVESSWRILDPLMKHWAKSGKPEQYPAGTWGPPSADRMLDTRRTHVEDAVIRDLTDTTTTGISKTLVRLRNEVGAMALGRVLTLVVVVEDTDAGDGHRRRQPGQPRSTPAASSSSSPATAGAATGSTPRSAWAATRVRARSSCCASTAPWPTTARASSCRCCCPTPRSSPGGPGEAPADVAKDPIGAMAQRRITDAAEHRNPRLMLKKRAANYAPGDTDLSWTRLTRWRGLLAAALDQPPYEPITERRRQRRARLPLVGPARRLARAPAQGAGAPRRRPHAGRASARCGSSARAGRSTSCAPATSSPRSRRPASPTGGSACRGASCPSASPTSCAVSTPTTPTRTRCCTVWRRCSRCASPLPRRPKAGKAPDPAESRRLAARLGRDESAQEASAMITAPPAPEHAETEQVRAATVRKLAGKRTPREAGRQGAPGEPRPRRADEGRHEEGHAAARRRPTTARRPTDHARKPPRSHHEEGHRERAARRRPHDAPSRASSSTRTSRPWPTPRRPVSSRP